MFNVFIANSFLQVSLQLINTNSETSDRTKMNKAIFITKEKTYTNAEIG